MSSKSCCCPRGILTLPTRTSSRTAPGSSSATILALAFLMPARPSTSPVAGSTGLHRPRSLFRLRTMPPYRTTDYGCWSPASTCRPASLPFPTAPDVGPHADTPTLSVPLVNVGQATNTITNNLTGKAALIQRGSAIYAGAINNAAQAGAAFAVIYNNAAGSSGCPGGDTLCPMAGTDFVPIPAVFIGETDGENLAKFYLYQQHRSRANPVDVHELYFQRHQHSELRTGRLAHSNRPP